MALVPYTVQTLARSDADGTGGSNIVVGAVISLTDSAGQVALMYDDGDGSNPSTAKTTNTDGQRIIWVEPDEYTITVNGKSSRVKISDKVFTTEGLIATTRLFRDGDVIGTVGYSSPGVGAASWVATSETGLTPSQAPYELGEHALTDASGRKWTLVDKAKIDVTSLGVLNDGTETRSRLQAVLKSNSILFFPAGDYLIDTTEGEVVGYSSGPALVIDGLKGLSLIGEEGTRFLSGTDAVSFILFLTSSSAATAGNYSKDIKVKDIEFVVFDHPVRTTQSIINLTSTVRAEISGCRFNAELNGVTNVLAITGTGGIGHEIHDNTHLGIATCHDNSQWYDCHIYRNKIKGGPNAVTAFNHFYDTNTLGNIRFENPPEDPLASGNIYSKNDISGYSSVFSLRGIKDAHVSNNKIHDLDYTDAATKNLISIFTDTQEDSAGYFVSGINVTGNIIWNINNTGGGTVRAVFINRFGSTRDVTNCLIQGNIMHDLTNVIGFSEDGVSQNTQVVGNNIDPATVTTPYGRNVILHQIGNSTGISPELQTSDGDLILNPAAGRFVRFGTYTADSGAPVAGYIEVRDKAGNTRRLAVVS